MIVKSNLIFVYNNLVNNNHCTKKKKKKKNLINLESLDNIVLTIKY
jgi:hypothetical protein